MTENAEPKKVNTSWGEAIVAPWSPYTDFIGPQTRESVKAWLGANVSIAVADYKKQHGSAVFSYANCESLRDRVAAVHMIGAKMGLIRPESIKSRVEFTEGIWERHGLIDCGPVTRPKAFIEVRCRFCCTRFDEDYECVMRIDLT